MGALYDGDVSLRVMPDNRIYVVDVFTRERYAGNQLAVVLHASSLTTDEMQRITRETNFSEAAFVESEGTRRGGYDVRIFDPVEELPFAGHPTLGTAFVIREHLRENQSDEIRLDLGVERIPVRVERDEEGDEFLWMRQIPLSFEETFDRSLIACVLGLDEEIGGRYPVRLGSFRPASRRSSFRFGPLTPFVRSTDLFLILARLNQI